MEVGGIIVIVIIMIGYDSSNYQWVLNPYSGNSNDAFVVTNFGYIGRSVVITTDTAVSPTLYLSSNVKISGGTGEESSPFQLSIE